MGKNKQQQSSNTITTATTFLQATPSFTSVFYSGTQFSIACFWSAQRHGFDTSLPKLRGRLPWTIFILLHLWFHAPANNYDILFLSFLVQPSIYDFPCQVICTSQYSANELYLDISATAFPYQCIFLLTLKHFSSITILLIQPYQCQLNTSQLQVEIAQSWRVCSSTIWHCITS